MVFSVTFMQSPHIESLQFQWSVLRPETFRFKISGSSQFTDRAMDDIYRESTGIPRSINRICEKCLMYAYQQNKRLVDEHMVRFVIEHEMLKGGAGS